MPHSSKCSPRFFGGPSGPAPSCVNVTCSGSSPGIWFHSCWPETGISSAGRPVRLWWHRLHTFCCLCPAGSWKFKHRSLSRRSFPWQRGGKLTWDKDLTRPASQTGEQKLRPHHGHPTKNQIRRKKVWYFHPVYLKSETLTLPTIDSLFPAFICFMFD